jgi:hypothetical protein
MIRDRTAAFLLGLLLALASGACGTGSSNVSARDAGAQEGATPTSYPAFKPSMPQLQKGSLAVISNPVVIPVYFAGESLQSGIDSGLSTWAASASVQAALGEYGVTSLKTGTAIPLTETPPATMAAADVQAWLEGKLDGTSAQFGPVDASTLASEIFVLFYPAATTVSYGSAVSCQDFDTYDMGVTLASGAVAHYVVDARCSPVPGMTQTEWLVLGGGSSAVDRIGSPTPSMSSTASGWAGFDAPHQAFASTGGELSTACTPAVLRLGGSPAREIGPVGAGPTAAVWSNTAAAAYHDPCLPAPSGPYFVSAPVASDTVTLTSGGTSQGVSVPVGQSKTVDVQLLSDGPTSGPWTVSTLLLGTSGFTFALDRTAGSNGDTLHLTVTAPSKAAQDTVAIFSTLGTRQAFWMLSVQSH